MQEGNAVLDCELSKEGKAASQKLLGIGLAVRGVTTPMRGVQDVNLSRGVGWRLGVKHLSQGAPKGTKELLKTLF
eukprot:1156698-Pelagomonas_calceolata.AAC.6